MIVPFPKVWFYVGGAVVVLLALVGLWAYGNAQINRMVADAAARAATERNAFWQGEIAKSNEAVERERAEQAIRAAAIEAETQAELATLRDQLKSIEAQNAALPNARACGIDSHRLRLLPP
jgi:hypothetical protein